MPMLAAANSIRKRTHTRKSSISRASRTGISLSALGFIFASAINLRALRALRVKVLVSVPAETRIGGG